jgi:hypothetical protein
MVCHAASSFVENSMNRKLSPTSHYRPSLALPCFGLILWISLTNWQCAAYFKARDLAERKEIFQQKTELYYKKFAWKSFKMMDFFVIEEKRQEFKNFLHDTQDKLGTIDNFSIQDVTFNADSTEAKVAINFRAVLLPDITLHELNKVDTWEWRNKDWVLIPNFSIFQPDRTSK